MPRWGCAGEEPLILARDQAYIGVMIDDLVTRGIGGEPYRMFTSRAEYRLLLREDNADRRLAAIGQKIGLLGSEAAARVQAKDKTIQEELQRLKQAVVPATDSINAALAAIGSAGLNESVRALELLRRPEVSYETLLELAGLERVLEVGAAAELEIEIKYAGYARRQAEAIERSNRLEHSLIPEGLDFGEVGGLSTEVRERLTRVRPRSLGQAARMPGVTPAAVSILAVHLRSRGARSERNRD